MGSVLAGYQKTLFLSTVDCLEQRCMVFSGGNQSVLSATVSGDPSHGGEEEGEWSVSVVVENELGNSSEIVVVLQSEAEWVHEVLYCM